MPLLRRMRVIGVGTEVTPGTAVAATSNTHNVYDLEIQATYGMSERLQPGGFGRLITVPEGHSGTVTFKMNPYGDGLGGPGAWATDFLPACGLVNAAGVFSPVAEAPPTNVKTITISVWEDGVHKQLVGAMGDFTLSLPTGRLAEIEFTFTGIWQTPTDVALPTPTFDSAIPFRSVGTLTLGTWTPCAESVSFNLGNSVNLRECQDNTSGYEAAIVTDRNTTISINPEATTVATNDAYTDWINSVEKAFSYSLTQGADVLTLDASGCQIMNIQEGDRNGVQIDDIELGILDDDFTLEFV